MCASRSTVPAGHKIAIRDVAEGAPVRRYNQIIGFATRPIRAGEHVHVHNLGDGRFRARLRVMARTTSRRTSSPIPATFLGIVRADGRVATRNYVGVVSSVNCSAHVCRLIADHFKGEALADYPNVDGVVPIHHKTGCGMGSTGEPVDVLRRVLGGLRHAPQHALDADGRAGLRGKPDQRSAGRSGPQAHRAAADHDDPGDRRHAQDGAGGHRAHQGAAAGSEQGQARAGSGAAI